LSKRTNLQLCEQTGATGAPQSAGAMVSGFVFSAALCLALVGAEEEALRVLNMDLALGFMVLLNGEMTL